jgi:CheY-like chemotaxis protein
LFLPEVHASQSDARSNAGPLAARARPPRLGYAGPRRRVLVVDNEEADRELLIHLLQPLGFELRTAASGHDCLDLLAAGYQPDVIFMDLAMPGIDGWETIRRLRALGHGPAQLAVVSANAFDKGLDNDVGLPAEDFILKPVRHSELLDWLERRLSLTWLDSPVVTLPAAQTPMAYPVMPTPAHLDALREVVNLGYYRGILNQLDEIETTQPECAAWVSDLRALARQFQFEAMGQQLNSPGQP